MSNKVSITKDSNIEHDFVFIHTKDNGSKDFICKCCKYHVGSVKEKPKYTSNALSFIPHESHGFYSGVFEEEDFANNREVVLYNESLHSVFCKGVVTTESFKDTECIDEDI